MYKTQTTIELLQEAVTATTQGGHNAGSQTDPLLHGGGGVLFAAEPFDQRRRRRGLPSEAGRYVDATEGGGSFAPNRRRQPVHPRSGEGRQLFFDLRRKPGHRSADLRS